MRKLRYYLFPALLLAGACGDAASTTSDLAGGGGGDDLAMGSGGDDLASGGGRDLPTGPDMTMATTPSMTITWRIYGVDSTGSMMQLDCDDPRAGITMFTNVVSNTGGKSATSTAACPAGMWYGDMSVATPDTVGNFAITTTPNGKGKPVVHPDYDVAFGDNGYEAVILVSL